MKKSAACLIFSALILFCTLWSAGPAPAFETAKPEQAGVDSGFLYDTLNLVHLGNLDIHSVLVLKNDSLILESYVHPYTSDTLHNIKSVSKSILSALVGIALEEKLIGGLDDKLADRFPEYMGSHADHRKAAIALEDLLTMQAGFKFKENSKMSDKWMRTDNWVKHAIAMPMAHQPGTRFTYSTANTHLASAWLTKAAGMDTQTFARKKLFDPLGIRDVTWMKAPEGIDMGGTQVYLTPRALLTFGQLYLKKGALGGKQVVPKDWVDSSTGVRTATVSGGGYGYWWWRTDNNDGYMAAGWGGQRIAVFPDKDLIIIITAGNAGHARFLLKQLSKGILFAHSPLPDNPAKQAALKQLVKTLAFPVPAPPAALPDIAVRISGQTYEMEKNRFGFAGLGFDFSLPGSAALIVALDGSDTFNLPMGVDGLYRLTDSPGMGHRRTQNTRLALKCRWDNEHLRIDMLPVGEPLRYTAVLSFNDPQLNGVMTFHPIQKQFVLKGQKR